MELIEYSNAQDFLKASHGILLEAEAENNLLLSSGLSLAKSYSGRLPGLSFYVARSRTSHHPLCAALQTQSKRLLLSTSSIESAAFLIQELINRNCNFNSLLGPEEPLRALLCSSTPSFREKFEFNRTFLQQILNLSILAKPASTPAPGLWRMAKLKDRSLLMTWSNFLIKEGGLDESPEETEKTIQYHLDKNQIFIYENKQPLAMAGYGGLTPNGARINMVYTLPQFRSQGYARTLVEAISRKLLNSNQYKFCFLMVAEENAAGVRAYERIGYKNIGRLTEYKVKS